MVNDSAPNIENIPTEYSVYLHPDFDAQLYANSVLNNEPYHRFSNSNNNSSNENSKNNSITTTTTTGDVSLALSKLNVGIEEISKRLRSEVSKNHLELLSKTGSISSLKDSLQATKNGLKSIESNVERLQAKIGVRYQSLEESLNRLDRYQDAAELCRRVSRFVSLSRRLESQMIELESRSIGSDSRKDSKSTISTKDDVNSSVNQQRAEVKEIVLAEAALSISELEKLLSVELEPTEKSLRRITNNSNNRADDSSGKNFEENNDDTPSISSLRAIQPHIRSIINARKKAENEMNRMLSDGLILLDRALLASSLQTAYNLSILDKTVGNLVLDLTEVVKSRVKTAFDINALAREAGNQEPPSTSGFSYKSRSRTEPTQGSIPQWTNLLWKKLGGLIEDLTSCCIKVYTLEQVLEWKKDPIRGISFLENVLSESSILERRPRNVFWNTLSISLEKEIREITRNSNFINQTLTASYPHLLRLFHDFFSRISLSTHTTYTAKVQSPETILTLRSIAPLESSYLNRCLNKIHEASNLNNSNNKIENFVAVIGNELDSARFDPILLRSVAMKITEVLENFIQRIENRISTNYQLSYFLGPTITQTQLTNFEILNVLLQLSNFLTNLTKDYEAEEDLIKSTIDPILKVLNERVIDQKLIGPIMFSIKRELSLVLSKMHYPIIGKMNNNSFLGNSNNFNNVNNTASYMQDLSVKLNFLKSEIFSRIVKTNPRKNLRSSLRIEITRSLIRNFLLNSSLINPLNEPNKVRLAGDLATLEFEINQFFSLRFKEEEQEEEDEGEEGDENENGILMESLELLAEFETLKTFRKLLFIDDSKEFENLVLIKNDEGGKKKDYKNNSSKEGRRENSKVTLLDELMILHHLISRHQFDHYTQTSSNNNNNRSNDQLTLIKLPHQLNRWSEAEYVRWIEEHPNKFDRLKLINESLKNFIDHRHSSNNLCFEGSVWIELALKILERINQQQ